MKASRGSLIHGHDLPSSMNAWTLLIKADNPPERELKLRSTVPASTVRVENDAVLFGLPDNSHAYMTCTGKTDFAHPPCEPALSLSPDTSYTLETTVSLSSGRASLWFIEYDARNRLCHQKQALHTGMLSLTWRTHAQHRSCRLAVRLSGSGELRLGPLILTKRSQRASSPPAGDAASQAALRTGPRGGFAGYSVFFDPSGYHPYTEKHHHFYDDRLPSWYKGLAGRFAGCRDVLDVGCGTGLLLKALKTADVANAVGLERDPVYLEACRKHDLTVFTHDLNGPFPFLASNSFDAVVAHQTLDYLAPIAIRTTLRECHRVLRPGGRLFIASRADGPESGDPTRTVPISGGFLRAVLDEAGFVDVDVTIKNRAIRSTARRSPDKRRWQTRELKLHCGLKIKPWKRPKPMLAANSEAWDNISRRNFTLLTDPAKNVCREQGAETAYFTAYREEAGQTERAVCRSVLTGGEAWRREPLQPVLTGGPAGSWDAGGLAAGSVIFLEQQPKADGQPTFCKFRMYFSGRREDGIWSGIGLAHSSDGIHWTKQPAPVLTIEAYPKLKHLALADVIRTTGGQWLMHCEGWIEGTGWAVFQAQSADGCEWHPTQAAPVLDPRRICWGTAHVANPKCVEPTEGHYVLGFNAADPSLAFQLGLAESENGREWRLLEINPVICTTGGDYRVESCFMPRDSLINGNQRVYFFAASTRATHASSHLLTTCADRSAEWVGSTWKTDHPGLYRIRENRLIAEPGAEKPAQVLHREIEIERELQCSLQLSGVRSGRGGVRILLVAEPHDFEMSIETSGRCSVNGETWAAPCSSGHDISLCLRILRPWSDQTEFEVRLWHGNTLVLDRQETLGVRPRRLRLEVKAPPNGPTVIVNHVDIWQPPAVPVDGHGDAQMYMGVCRSGDELRPDIDSETFEQTLIRRGIRRALVMPYGSTRVLDSFDQISALALNRPGAVHPLIRLRSTSMPEPADVEFQLNQLELLWQTGRMVGFKIHMKQCEIPPREMLNWIERRQVLTLWHIGDEHNLDWLVDNVLEPFTFPVLLSHFGGYPLDRSRYQRAIDLMDRFRQLYLISSVVWFRAYLEKAARRHPHRVLHGSDYPAVDPAAARSIISTLDVPRETKTLVLSENLRFLIERTHWFRRRAIRSKKDLRFPPLPATADEMTEQGFALTAPANLSRNEPDEAKAFWSAYEVKSWYREDKPWARLLTDLVADLKPRSVLEFGCNVGRNLAAIARDHPEVHLVGIDVNPEAVRLGRQHAGLDLRVGDENTLRAFAEGEFDLLFTVSVLDHIPEIAEVCKLLARCAARFVFCLEVTLPVEGKVVRHFDHKRNQVSPSTEASYSWHVERYLGPCPRVRRIDRRPCYLHSASLGPYYYAYLAHLDPPKTDARQSNEPASARAAPRGR